ncbi:hypothetical protein [Agromyces sp. NPDC058110]|uniref:hypothetical protein n=1 Tax=Agromyces sp. NPDC058110 TaxID=3346345 RepID=UPI0036D792A9
MMISELSYLHLQHVEEVRIAAELERRREQQERALDDDAFAVAASGRGAGRGWWASVLHPRVRQAAASPSREHARAA